MLFGCWLTVVAFAAPHSSAVWPTSTTQDSAAPGRDWKQSRSMKKKGKHLITAGGCFSSYDKQICTCWIQNTACCGSPTQTYVLKLSLSHCELIRDSYSSSVGTLVLWGYIGILGHCTHEETAAAVETVGHNVQVQHNTTQQLKLKFIKLSNSVQKNNPCSFQMEFTQSVKRKKGELAGQLAALNVTKWS